MLDRNVLKFCRLITEKDSIETKFLFGNESKADMIRYAEIIKELEKYVHS